MADKHTPPPWRIEELGSHQLGDDVIKRIKKDVKSRQPA